MRLLSLHVMQCFCFPFFTLWPFICWSANNISPICLSSVHHKKNFEDTVLFFFFLLHLIQSRIYNSDISSIDRWNLSNCLSNIDSKHRCLDCNRYISSSLSKNEKASDPNYKHNDYKKDVLHHHHLCSFEYMFRYFIEIEN